MTSIAVNVKAKKHKLPLFKFVHFICVFLIDPSPYTTVNKCSAPKRQAALKECFTFLKFPE